MRFLCSRPFSCFWLTLGVASILDHCAWGLSIHRVVSTVRSLTSSCLFVSDTDEDYYINLLKEEEEVEEDESIDLAMEAAKVNRDKQRLKKEWGRELENWKQLGVQVRRDRRDRLRKKRFAVQADAIAQDYILTQSSSLDNEDEDNDDLLASDDDSSGIEIPKVQLERASAFFQRLLEHLFEMEQEAYERGKQHAIDRECQKVNGTATDIEEYLQELEAAREMEQDRRKTLKEIVFELPQDWELLEDEELRNILKIRGNLRNTDKVQKRETIERYIQESYSKPLF